MCEISINISVEIPPPKRMHTKVLWDTRRYAEEYRRWETAKLSAAVGTRQSNCKLRSNPRCCLKCNMLVLFYDFCNFVKANVIKVV
ncbi:hypothetical protein CEXT_279181 [Caerostris extrusa]|uniref:Uncharacterized protein n=1 Tax=Caerostris extrusa TaxID=172846 RepID=A0AAV4VCU8_CAEEX|nr:hypothetical protein CEXT_279181 [Caerostris extrusa]